jgi:hypothetical protein
LAGFTNLLNSGGTPGQVVNAITSSQEYRQDEVQTQYNLLLHRGADPMGLSSFTNLLASGGTLEQVDAALAGSGEYFQNRGGGTNDGFLDALFSDALHRPVDASGRAQFDQALATGTTRQQVAAQVFASGEYKGFVVQSFYLNFLHRQADGGGLFTHVNELQSGLTDEQLVAVFVGSAEYFGKTAS